MTFKCSMQKKMESLVFAGDIIYDLVAKMVGWSYDNDKDCVVDTFGNEVGWDDFESIPLEPAVEHSGVTYDCVNVWGDGTVEFQDDQGESTNWSEFDDGLYDKVIAALEK